MDKNVIKVVDEKTYYDQMHRIGFCVLGIAIIIFFAIPTIISVYFNVIPKFSDLLIAAGGLCAPSLSRWALLNPLWKFRLWVLPITSPWSPATC